MPIVSFLGGILVGSLAMLLFIYIVAAISTAMEKKNLPSKKTNGVQSPIFNERIVKELWREYLKEREDDGK